MIMVVFLHAYNLKINIGEKIHISTKFTVSYFLESFLSDGIFRLAIPLFFIMSGYLFFISVDKFNVNIYREKLIKRVKTLAFPYIFWSAAGLITLLVLSLIPLSDKLISTFKPSRLSFTDILFVLFLNPVPYQLWFLRVLFVVIIFSPLIYILVTKLRNLTPIFILIFWGLEDKIPFMDYFWSYGISFFTLGAYFARQNILSVYKIRKKFLALFTILYLVIILVRIYFHYYNYEVYSLYLKKIYILMGIGLFWFWLDYIIPVFKKIDRDYHLSEFSFTIFVLHEPMQVIMKKVGFYILDFSVTSELILYIILPLIVITFSIFIGKNIKSNFPDFYKLITGNR